MKRKVLTTMQNIEIINLFDRLINKRIDVNSIAQVLDCSVRTVYRLRKKYSLYGVKGLNHKNIGKVPVNKISESLKKKILELYSTDVYCNSNFTHFSELLKRNHNINISPSFIHTLMKENLIYSKKAHRATKKHFKKLSKAIEKSNDKAMVIQSVNVSNKREFFRRERKKNFGELIQMDASVHEWIKGVKWNLHLAIDDATGIITGAFFDKQETLFGYQNVMIETINKYGIPKEVLTDRRSVFTNNKKHEIPTLTQFGYSCNILGVKLSVTSIPQTKGRVERSFNTHQDRLITELLVNNITDINSANEFLKVYIEKHNSKFSYPNNYTQNLFVFNNDFDLNDVFSRRSVRKTDIGGTFKFNNNHYLILDENNETIKYRSGREVIVHLTFNGKMYVIVNDKNHSIKIINSKCNYSLGYKPKNNHPWKLSFAQYLNKQKNIKVLR